MVEDKAARAGNLGVVMLHLMAFYEATLLRRSQIILPMHGSFLSSDLVNCKVKLLKAHLVLVRARLQIQTLRDIFVLTAHFFVAETPYFCRRSDA